MKKIPRIRIEVQQPAPVFFTPEQIERMTRQEGSYQYKGGQDGEETDS